MRKIGLLVLLAGAAMAQVVTIPDEFPATSLAKINGNFAWLNGHINGTSVPVNAAADQLVITTGPAVAVWAAVPNCSGALQYSTATHTFACAAALAPTAHAGTHGQAGADAIALDATQISSGTIASVRMPLPGASTVGAVRSADCSGTSQFVQKVNTDGTITCATPTGSGNVNGPGSSTDGYIPQWNSTTGTLLKTGLALVTSLPTPGTDAQIPTAAAVRAAIPTALPPNGSAGGDLGGSYPTPSVSKVNGVSYGSSPAVDTLPLITSTNTAVYTALCAGTLSYSTSTHAFSCTSLGALATAGYPATGIVKSNGSAFSAAAAGTDYVAPAGNVATATALASAPTKCSAGNYPLGIDAGGNAQNCTAAGGGAITHQFNGLNQAGVSGWNLQFDALTNIALSTVDPTHISPLLVVTANTTGSALRSLSLVTSTVTSVIFAATVRSTDTTNSGSIALDYSCQVDGGSLDAPAFTGLTALTLASVTTTSKTYASTQSVSCTGTASAPARLWVRWTPTAPSGGTLSIAELAVTY